MGYSKPTMLFTNTTFIGIDPTAGKKPFAYVALDGNLRLLALGHGGMDEVLAFVAGQREATVAVCAPRRPNQGIMKNPEVRERLSPPPRPGRWTNFRLAEYIIRQHNIHMPQTASQVEKCPRWMQMGFTLFQRLESLGYQAYPKEDGQRQSLEVYPHACYTVLLGVTPFHKHSLEGRLQRQLIMYESNINVADPIRLFEEITRHRLLQGILLDDDLCSPGELDAMVAAYTAWLAITDAERVSLIGDPGEGQITLPIGDLKPRY
jgi:hypothetical protein